MPTLIFNDFGTLAFLHSPFELCKVSFPPTCYVLGGLTLHAFIEALIFFAH
jgi:hypothetical protein